MMMIVRDVTGCILVSNIGRGEDSDDDTCEDVLL
jgi:hypothetical protein